MAGKYQGIIPDTISLTENVFYFLEITSSSGSVLLSREKCLAVYHNAQHENNGKLEIWYIYIGSDNLIEIILTNNQTGEYVEDADVSMTLKTAAGVAVSGAANIEMVHQS